MNQKTKKLMYQLSFTMFDTIKAAQQKLAEFVVPESGIAEQTLINNLLGILDERRLVVAMNEISDSQIVPLEKLWPESKSVARTSYYAEKQTLEVLYKNHNKYHYENVPCELWDSLVATSSIGSFLNNEVRGKYQFQPIIY